MSDKRVTANARYKALAVKREPYLRRARRNAEMTIPSILPPDGHTGSSLLVEPFQGLGARGVVFLASRLLTALYPPGTSSFRLQIPAEVVLAEGSPVSAEIEGSLVNVETLINSEIERRQWRSPTNTVLQHLVVAGNVLEQMLPDNRIKAYRLDQYCQVKDPAGRLIELVIEEKVYPDNLPEEVRGLVKDVPQNGQEKINLYTWVKRLKDGTWRVHQELGDEVIGASVGKTKVLPFNSLGWSQGLGEDYARSKVDDHIADLISLNHLRKAMVEGAAMASRHINMVRPNAAGGLKLRRRLAQAENGDYIVGNPEDVEMKQFTNTAGLAVAQEEISRLSQELASAFLMNSSARRDAERVTATELRLMTEELEGSLGGVFSMLSQDMQRNRLMRLIAQMQSNEQLPEWPDGIVEPTVITGLEALGREQDVVRVTQALQTLQGFDEATLMYVKMPELLGKLFNGLQLSDAVRSEAEVAQKQQEQMAAQIGQSVAEAGGVAAAQQAVAPPQ